MNSVNREWPKGPKVVFLKTQVWAVWHIQILSQSKQWKEKFLIIASLNSTKLSFSSGTKSLNSKTLYIGKKNSENIHIYCGMLR